MKAKKLTAPLLLLSLAGALTIGCSKKDAAPPAPSASFTYSGAGLAPATVSFTNTSTDATSYAWDFGDNGSSTERSPSHAYTKGGVYTVTLTAKNAKGTSSTATRTVNIQAPTSVKITGVKVVQIPFTTTNGGGWDNNSGPDVSYSITDESDHVLVTPTTYFPNVTSAQLPLAFALPTPLQVTNFATVYKIHLWDYDGDDLPANPDDWMGGYQFSFSGFASSGYPTTATLSAAGSSLKLELSLQWQ